MGSGNISIIPFHILSDMQRVLKTFEVLDNNVSVFTILTFSEEAGQKVWVFCACCHG